MVYKGQMRTPYYYMVLEAIRALEGEGHKAITQPMIAHRIGRKVTQSLRRALEQAENDGVVKKFKWITEKGGLSVAYELLPDQKELPLKERPF